jgi:hypothetical protein
MTPTAHQEQQPPLNEIPSTAGGYGYGSQPESDDVYTLPRNAYFFDLCRQSTDTSNTTSTELFLHRSHLGLPSTPDDDYNLYCFYSYGLLVFHPYLLLAPLKTEEMSYEPEIYIFHDIVSESEIEDLFQEVEGKVTIIDMFQGYGHPRLA